METYSYIVLPSNGPRLWPIAQEEPINPIVMRRTLGRPKKKRSKANDKLSSSNVLPRHLTNVKCKNYGSFWNNSRTYKGKIVADRQLPKGINKEKKQKKGSTQVPPTILTQGSQASQTQE